MIDQSKPEGISDEALDDVQGAGTAVGNPGEKKVLDDGQPLVEVNRSKPSPQNAHKGVSAGIGGNGW